MNPGTSGLERGLAVLQALARRRGLEPRRPRRRTPRRADRQRQEPDFAHTRHARRARARRARPGNARLPHRLADLRTGRARGRAAPAGRGAAPVARARAQLGESAHLSVRQGDSVLTLLSESPASAIHAPAVVGSLTPLANTSAGRALAFDLADAELAELGLAEPPTASPRRARSATRSCARSSSPASWPRPRRCATAPGASSPRSTSRRRPSVSRAARGGRRSRGGRGGRALGRARRARDNPRPRRTDQQFPAPPAQ